MRCRCAIRNQSSPKACLAPRSVFFISIAIVIGPTPPGIGVRAQALEPNGCRDSRSEPLVREYFARIQDVQWVQRLFDALLYLDGNTTHGAFHVGPLEDAYPVLARKSAA